MSWQLLFMNVKQINNLIQFHSRSGKNKMLQFQLLQVQDVKEAAAIERKRRYEEERRKRIFNARNRLIGVDPTALEKQIQERNQQEQEQKKLDGIFGEQQNRNAQLAIVLEKQEREERRKLNEEINTFRKVYQKYEDRREFDLNDPKVLLNSLPMRLNDDDPRCGISSAQKFEGEDLTSDARRKLQIEQTKAWLQQQIKEQKSAEQELKDAEAAYQAAIVARDGRAVELDKLEKECKKKLEEARTKFNKSMTEQQKIEKDLRKHQELEDNFAEMYNAVTGDFLTENPRQAQSNLGSNRPIAYMYKGMSQEEREVFRKQQLLQIEQNKMRREEVKNMEKYWNDFNKGMGASLAKLDIEQRSKRKELNKKMAEYNRSLAEEQKAQKEYFDHVIYTNKPTAAYYEQFNTTTR